MGRGRIMIHHTYLNKTNTNDKAMPFNIARRKGIMNIKTTLLSALIVLSTVNHSALYAQTNADYSATPPAASIAEPPQIMLTMSRDHQYFFKAYNDYTDLDINVDDNNDNIPDDLDVNGNPIVETTYKHSFDYFGYFDPEKCYVYSTGDNRFNPDAITNDKYCAGNQWSGNFLNWASMSRMDIVRKIFYGGKRSTDTSTNTVLERAFLPSDAHSFAKYYNGDDLHLLTPFDNFRTDTRNSGDNDGFDDMNEGITLCNTTYDSFSGASQESTNPPLIRVAEGNFQLWGANERWQCTWSNERGNRSNSNIPPSNPLTININGTNVSINSGIDASPRDPDRATNNGTEYIARVRACVPNLVHLERCKEYPDGNLKPVGLLQTYGDTGIIQFGLMTGSYENNVQGGVLRKNTTDFSDEVNVDSDGTFSFSNTSDSIVRTLDRLRPWGYRYSDGTYRGGGTRFDDCSFQLTNIPNGRCNSWGNPISEIYKETIRYIAGLGPSANFQANDNSFISGLTTATWNNPLDDENQCAGLNTIVINASVSSYDDDETGIADVTGGINGSTVGANGTTTNTWTDRIGAQEGIHGDDFFIGRSGADINEFCDAKTVNALSDTFGLCPEAPTVSGSFAIGGIAYYAHNNDIRPDLDGNQTVNTFAISLATNTPIINIPRTDGGTPVSILPAYRLLRGDQGGGALVDFKIVQPHTRVPSTNRFTGSYYVNWEDSEQGGDYDQDLWGLIQYELDQGADTVTITTTAVAESTGQPQLFGFVTNGTTQDGFHAYSGIEGANFTDPTGVPGCTNCRPLQGGGQQTGQFGPQSHTFNIAASSARELESPLFYAAKYGGFSEIRDDTESAELTDIPDEVDEWDRFNNITGEEAPDGLPDNYFFVINPEELFTSLERSLLKILSEKESANTAIGNFANADGDSNLVVQGFYQELRRDETNTPGSEPKEVAWTGELISYFIDDFGLFREDTNGNGELDDYNEDLMFTFEFDDTTRTTEIQNYDVNRDTDGDIIFASEGELEIRPIGSLRPISSLNTIWDAGQQLRNLDNASIITQRNYALPVANNAASRHIFSYIDADLDGRVDANEQFDFVSSEIDNTNFRAFGVNSINEAQTIVNYVRGFEDPSLDLRNRTIETNNGLETYRLGDIVNSSPRIVGAPTQAYDTNFGDDAYAEFRELYEDRRHVVYVGANDGLLHAFNAGFKFDGEVDPDPTDDIVGELALQYNEQGSTTSGGNLRPNTGSQTDHPLGAELWAYAPYNLLPHLQWLTSGFYTHVYYVDGPIETYEVKIPSLFQGADHPGGWATILVAGMRLGGGDFPLTLNSGASTTTRSAYVILDVTNPEEPPELIAEITHEDLNFTTSKPTLFYECGNLCRLDGGSNVNARANNRDNQNKFNGSWKLVFGSGPNNLKTYLTSETAKVFMYDIEDQLLEMKEVEVGGNTVTNSFVGNLTTRDWDNGELGSRDDDVVYFGTIGTTNVVSTGGNIQNDKGGVYRVQPQTLNNDTSLLYDAERPVPTAPLALSNERLGNNVLGSWIYFGTGTYLRQQDQTTNLQERFYGIREPIDTNPFNALVGQPYDPNRANSALLTLDEVEENDLQDVTDIQIVNDNNGEITLPVGVSNGDLANPRTFGARFVTNFDELREYIVQDTQGWYRDLPTAITPSDPSARITSRASFLKTQLFFTTFQPDSQNLSDICLGELGESELFALNLTTGTASGFAALGTIDETTGIAIESKDIGVGPAATPVVFTSEAIGGNKARVITQKSNNQTDNEVIRTSRDFSTRAGWREIIQD